MTKQGNTYVFDLKERTFKFGVNTISLARQLPYDRMLSSLVNQLIRSSTSIGANYMEADSAQTKKDFLYKISLCRKEAMETRYWLRLIEISKTKRGPDFTQLQHEANELALIFSSIYRRGRSRV